MGIAFVIQGLLSPIVAAILMPLSSVSVVVLVFWGVIGYLENGQSIIKNMSRVILIVSTFIWCGLLLGISFMEAPLKFQAPNITLELGLGIGQLVFGALNKMELVLAVLIGGSLWAVKPSSRINLIYGIIITILLAQTFVLLPFLSERIVMIQSGQTPPDSPMHLYYIIAEVVKLVLLMFGGVSFLKANLK